ncbi:hypothetical protein [uncultured Novosphingobium sp.]|uniref:hypothetical protein n=1 Tax=uncultured Novosphingobium sp. TaxID=292277 RepID=UPI00259A7DC5|nr:hypothetical protein [uncultured Novosphingobium sp.]
MVASGAAAFDFIFEPNGRINKSALVQGDLLRRTADLAAMIGEAHSYYAEAPDYSHFLVLTQSCDLVRRKGSCKAPYITICAVRPLSLFVEREFAKYSQPIPGFPIMVGDLKESILARQLLERVMNNTVDGIFFIPRGAAPGVNEHLCAFLPLSIALRAEHYDKCLAAKVGQATEIFGAKIGSLTSALYARIATTDFTEQHGQKAAEAYRKSFFEELGYRSIAWLSPFQRDQLSRQVSEVVGAGGNGLANAEAKAILKALPSEVDALATRAVEILKSRKLVQDDPDILRKAANFLKNDGEFRKLAKRDP